jgi:formylmethanofuran dehydrogenase subunit E-like metal-binding protein
LVWNRVNYLIFFVIFKIDSKIALMKAVPGIAGIFIRWNSTTNEGDALVLSYNSSSVQSGWTGPDWGSKIASAVALMDYTDRH